MATLRALGPDGGPRIAELAERLEAALGPILVPLILPAVLETLREPAPAPASSGEPTVLLTVDEAARRLNVGRTTVFALIRDGRVGSVMIGRRRLVPPSAIDAYVAELVAGHASGPAA